MLVDQRVIPFCWCNSTNKSYNNIRTWDVTIWSLSTTSPASHNGSSPPAGSSTSWCQRKTHWRNEKNRENCCPVFSKTDSSPISFFDPQYRLSIINNAIGVSFQIRYTPWNDKWHHVFRGKMMRRQWIPSKLPAWPGAAPSSCKLPFKTIAAAMPLKMRLVEK